MQKYLVPILAGLGAAVVAGALFGALLGADILTYFMGAFVGFFTFYILANLAGNRKVAMASVAERDQAARLEPAPVRCCSVSTAKASSAAPRG